MLKMVESTVRKLSQLCLILFTISTVPLVSAHSVEQTVFFA